MPSFLIKLVSTCFFIGYLPFVPGTFASIAALGLFFLVKDAPATYLSALAISITIGLLTAGRAERLLRKKDHRAIVIDEVAGMLLSLVCVPHDFRLYVLGFFLFRLLDTVKPYPADWLQERQGGLGVMGDDLIAGLYTNIILQVVARLIARIGS